MKGTNSEKRGDQQFKEGKSKITTSFFNWSKDYASGASYFQEALKCYQMANCYEKCVKTLKELIICNEKNLDNWGVARNYEALVDIYVTQQPDIPLQILKETATTGFVHFRMAESLDKGLSMIGKVAKHLIKRNQMQEGIDLLEKAYEIAHQEEKSFKSQDIFNQIVDVFLENGLYLQAEKLYWEEMKFRKGVDCNQLGLILMILMILQHEPARAEQQMYQISNVATAFLESDECEVGDELIKSYRKGEVDKFKKLTTKPEVTCLFPLCIIRKLRQVVVPSAKEGDATPSQQVVKDLLY